MLINCIEDSKLIDAQAGIFESTVYAYTWKFILRLQKILNNIECILTFDSIYASNIKVSPAPSVSSI